MSNFEEDFFVFFLVLHEGDLISENQYSMT